MLPSGMHAQDSDGAYTFSMMLYYVDCKAKSVAIPQMIFYASNGSVAGSYNQKFDPNDLQDVSPGTLGLLALDYICHQSLSGR